MARAAAGRRRWHRWEVTVEIRRAGSQRRRRRRGAFHRNRPHRSAGPGERAGADRRCLRHVRTLRRRDWHTHPLGQTDRHSGCGLHQRWGGPVEEIRPGDVVSVGPNEKHWHGASPTTAMTQIAIKESCRTARTSSGWRRWPTANTSGGSHADWSSAAGSWAASSGNAVRAPRVSRAVLMKQSGGGGSRTHVRECL